VLWALGVFLVAPGLVAPQILAPVHRGWMAAASVLSKVNTRIILTALFYTVLTPIGCVLRLVRDPLGRSLKESQKSNWVRRAPCPHDPSTYERQF
jgi:multisubunit Na+/H+ antiporter MnhG subunit